AQQPQVHGTTGEDGGDAAEDRPELHHPVVAPAIGQRPEDRRQDKLRREERRTEEADDDGLDALATMGRQVGQVVRKQRTCEAGAESQRERAENDGKEGALHRGRLYRLATALSSRTLPLS